MLPERYHQLLTACVDGELNRRDRRRVERLLKRSAEARQVLHKLQEDARALRHLPRTSPPPNLADAVLTKIHERRLRPGRNARLNNPPALPPWAGLAAAAAVLLVVGVASYLYFAASFLPPQSAPVARRPQPSRDKGTQDTQNAPSALEKPASVESVTPHPHPDSPHPPAQPPTPAAPDVVRQPQTPPPGPTEVPEDGIFAGSMDQLLITRVDGSLLPLVFKLTDLRAAPGRDRALAELRQDRAFRLELPCHNGARAMERLQTVLRKQQAHLLLDPKAQERLGQPRIVTSFAVYLEDLTPEQLLQLLTEMSAEDARIAAHHPSEGQLDRLVLCRLSPPDHKELTALFGLDPTQPPVKSPGLLPTDPTKPLSDLTAQQVERSLAGQGGPPRPQGSKSSDPAGRTVLIAPYPATLSHGGTAEMRQHLATRKPPRAGTLSVVLIFRTS